MIVNCDFSDTQMQNSLLAIDRLYERQGRKNGKDIAVGGGDQDRDLSISAGAHLAKSQVCWSLLEIK